MLFCLSGKLSIKKQGPQAHILITHRRRMSQCAARKRHLEFVK